MWKNRKEYIAPLEDVDREWNVRKHASRSRRVGPVGILYIGYLHQKWK